MDRPKHFNALRHPIETARTAPLGTLLMGANAILATYMSSDFIEKPELASAFPFAVSLAGLVPGFNLVANQLKVRDRVEASIEKDGFDERIMSTTTDEWCNRQTVRTALAGTEHEAAYKQLCQQRRATAHFRWLPHI